MTHPCSNDCIDPAHDAEYDVMFRRIEGGTTAHNDRLGNDTAESRAANDVLREVRERMTAAAAGARFGYHEAMQCVEVVEADAAARDPGADALDQMAQRLHDLGDACGPFALDHPPMMHRSQAAALLSQTREGDQG